MHQLTRKTACLVLEYNGVSHEQYDAVYQLLKEQNTPSGNVFMAHGTVIGRPTRTGSPSGRLHIKATLQPGIAPDEVADAVARTLDRVAAGTSDRLVAT